MKKTVLITGASKGIGKELALIFAKNGYDLILIARTLKELESLKESISEQYQRQVNILSLDLSLENAVDTIMHTFQDELRHLDVLVNNAGYGLACKFTDMPAEDVQGMLAVNINILTQLTYRVLPFMVENKKGKILNVASVAAYTPGPYMAMYYASKSYVLSFSEALHEEYRADGITISALCPGITPTSFQERAGIAKTRMMDGLIPLMTAEEVANIAFHGLMRDKSVIVTGFINKLAVLFLSLMPRAWNAKISAYVSKPRAEKN
ncbi:MAG TPA: SDR family oxidoreductase [Gammaproteobacteria bacterium]|jgi:hypothetical protein|nr:SDR family oxidoreductase [Gammaproteobacteria bacterium]